MSTGADLGFFRGEEERGEGRIFKKISNIVLTFFVDYFPSSTKAQKKREKQQKKTGQKGILGTFWTILTQKSRFFDT